MKEGKGVVYSDPVMEYLDEVMVTPDRRGKGLSELRVLGTVRGFTPWEYLKRIEKGEIKLHENDTIQGLLQQAIHGRIDGAYFSVVVAKYQLREVLKTPQGLVFDPQLPHTRSAHLLSTLKYPQIIQELNGLPR